MITQRPDMEWFEASVNLASMASSRGFFMQLAIH